MPRVGQEPARRAALVDATIAEIGRAGSLEVTVGQIARRAGMSTALAHYYFDTKDAIFLAAMRHILTAFANAVRQAVRQHDNPEDRLRALIQASLAPEQFDEANVSAWLVFYVRAQKNADAARLLRIYARRLHSNLMAELTRLLPRQTAEPAARGIAAMIDGIYIRHALHEPAVDVGDPAALVINYLDLVLMRGQA